jgi:hypothetical protein
MDNTNNEECVHQGCCRIASYRDSEGDALCDTHALFSVENIEQMEELDD